MVQRRWKFRRILHDQILKYMVCELHYSVGPSEVDTIIEFCCRLQLTHCVCTPLLVLRLPMGR